MAPDPAIYTVRLSEQARRDVQESADYIREGADTQRANIWMNGLLDALESLARMPARYAVAPESGELGTQVRHLPYFSHRILFRVQDTTRTVQVLRVYHGARMPLRIEDLP